MSNPPKPAQDWTNPAPGFARLDAEPFPVFEPGTVWLVGAGPGAPGLMSLMAYHAMQHADVVVYDALVNPDILRWVRAGASLEYAGKRGGKPSASQRDISERLVELARGPDRVPARVLRLKGGDPFIFGRGGEEAQALKSAGVPFRIVPGISAGIGGLAYAGIPATHRDLNHSVIFLTGHDATGALPANVDWRAIATASPVIVMYMAVKHLPEIAAALLAGGRDPADTLTIVSNATLPHQSVLETRLSDIEAFLAQNTPDTPAIVVAGKVESWRAILDWYDQPARESPIG
jgi:uroporphyrin-III C-methyltransferase